ncbi:MAG: chromosome segregation protein SMC [Acidimicrobiales bacterium]
MFLRSLTLKGFKSFAEPTTLEFEPGVTVVVGPNGSGKSNVVDAVAWVLGAQGPRTVRSTRMDDVIFAGSGRHSPLGRAEVTLTIDNSSGLLPIEFSEVTIRRTLFRSSGESEYALNGVPCRLLDLQELLSDTGVGRQQHVIVSQGQLDAVLDARPEDRRMIVEEAAGILKFRRRKEKAQRRLEATEVSLARLGDLLREVRRQLRPLERQAEAARRHGDLTAELRELRLYLAGRQVAGLRARSEAAVRAVASLAVEESQVAAELRALDTDVAAAEAWLTSVGHARLDESVARLEALYERARGLVAVLAERRKSIERDRQASVDAAVVASLEADAHGLALELADVDRATSGLGPEFEHLRTAEAEVVRQRAELEERRQGGDASAGARVAEARGELSALRSAAHRDRAERTRLENRLASLEADLEVLAADAAARRRDLDELGRERGRLALALDEAETARRASAVEADAAEAALRRAEGERAVWGARVDALALALDNVSVDGGGLDDVDGVVGRLAELVTVEVGWEAAFEAAAAEALGAVVVEDVDAARACLAGRTPDAGPLAIVALGPSGPLSGVPGSRLHEAGPPAVAVPGARVVEHVQSSHPGVAALLDTLLVDAVAVDGWEEAVDLALAHPRVVVVTRSGDRFSARGWRVGGGGRAATEAALGQARSRADEATLSVSGSAERLRLATEALTAATARCDQRARALSDHDRRLSDLTEAVGRLEARRHDAASAVGAVRDGLATQDARLVLAETRLADLEAAIPALEAEETAGAEAASVLQAERRRLQEQAEAVAAMATELEIRRAGLEQRRHYLAGRLADVEGRLARAGADRARAESRRADLELAAVRTDRLAAAVDARLDELRTRLTDTRLRRQAQVETMGQTSQRLDDLRRRRSEAGRRLEEVRERSRRAELEGAEARMRLEAAVEAVRRELDVEPEVAAAAPLPELPPGSSAESRARELERELRLMGPVNQLATEELATLQERHAFVEGQLDDVKNTRRELGRVVRAVDAEIVQLLGAAYADVADNFEHLFETLFPGGQGRLRLTDADDLLDTGIEIEARPAGKNVRRLSLLSGGERSLCALAFLFAVFRSRPSPFYLLDEVEAALDDVNLHRFLDLLAEFRQEAQLVVVSHQKRTMEAADCLYGVSMQPGGSSRVVSQRVGAVTG